MADVLWSLIVLIVFGFFLTLGIFLKGLFDKLISLIETLIEKINNLESEIKPILKDMEKSLDNIEPLTKELGNRGKDIGRLLRNIEKVTDDAQATTGAIRNGIVPIAHTITGLYAGIVEGTKALGESRRPRR